MPNILRNCVFYSYANSAQEVRGDTLFSYFKMISVCHNCSVGARDHKQKFHSMTLLAFYTSELRQCAEPLSYVSVMEIQKCSVDWCCLRPGAQAELVNFLHGCHSPSCFLKAYMVLVLTTDSPSMCYLLLDSRSRIFVCQPGPTGESP